MKQVITAMLVLSTGLLSGQSFEGTLVYKVDMQFQISEKMAKMGVTEEKMKERMKQDGSWVDSVRHVYKQGNYAQYTESSPRTWSVYKQNTNKLYTFQDGDAADICTVTDVSKDTEFQLTGQKPLVTSPDTLVDVNGMPCKIVRVQWKSGTYDYYYNSSFLKTDARLFENHVYDGWADFLKISGALPVKIVKSTKGLATMTYTLGKHTEGTIDPKVFEIPELVADKDLNIKTVPNREFMRIKKN